MAYGRQRGRVARLKIKENPLRPSPPRDLRDRRLADLGSGGLAEQQLRFAPGRENAVDQAPLTRSFCVHEVVVIQRRAQGGRQGRMSPTPNRNSIKLGRFRSNCDVHRHDQQRPLHFDLTRSPRRPRMTAPCAKQTARVDVKRASRTTRRLSIRASASLTSFFWTWNTRRSKVKRAVGSHPVEDHAQIVCRHFGNSRNRESSGLGYRSDRLEVSQTPGRVAIAKVPVERLVAWSRYEPFTFVRAIEIERRRPREYEGRPTDQSERHVPR